MDSDEPIRIDVDLDLRLDAKGKDPDRHSLALQKFSQRLWQRELPSGKALTLTLYGTKSRGFSLKHDSELGSFALSNDTIANSNKNQLKNFYEEMGVESNQAWHKMGLACRILFPGNSIDGEQTINQRRGTHPKIKDRFDLTLECIRIHYQGGESPLSETLERYSDFFSLFEDFEGYVNFWLLQDLVNDDFTEINFYLPFEGFINSPLPKTFEEYKQFRENQSKFINARKERILELYL